MRLYAHTVNYENIFYLSFDTHIQVESLLATTLIAQRILGAFHGNTSLRSKKLIGIPTLVPGIQLDADRNNTTCQMSIVG